MHAGTNTVRDGYYIEDQGLGNHHGQPNVLYDQMSQPLGGRRGSWRSPERPYYFCIAVTNAITGESPTAPR